MGNPIIGVQAISTGFPGAPGYTTLYFSAATGTDRDNACEAAHTFWNNCKGLFPDEWSVQLAPEHRVLDCETGELLSYHSTPGTADDPVVGTDGANRFAAGPAGVCVSWSTDTVNWSRKVRGRTFLVPIGGSAIEANGSLEPGGRSSLEDHGQTLIDDGASTFIVWSRPRSGAGGVDAEATIARINDKVAVLRSRR